MTIGALGLPIFLRGRAFAGLSLDSLTGAQQ